MFPRNISSQKCTNAHEHVERTNTVRISLTQKNLNTQELILRKGNEQINAWHKDSWVEFHIWTPWLEGVKLSDLCCLLVFIAGIALPAQVRTDY